MDYINKIFKTVSIKDNRRIIELYFQELYCFAPLSNKALSQKLLLPVPIVTAIKNEGIRLGILEQCSGGVGLTHNGKDYVEQALGFKGIWKTYEPNDVLASIEAVSALATDLKAKINKIIR